MEFRMECCLFPKLCNAIVIDREFVFNSEKFKLVRKLYMAIDPTFAH